MAHAGPWCSSKARPITAVRKASMASMGCVPDVVLNCNGTGIVVLLSTAVQRRRSYCLNEVPHWQIGRELGKSSKECCGLGIEWKSGNIVAAGCFAQMQSAFGRSSVKGFWLFTAGSRRRPQKHNGGG